MSDEPVAPPAALSPLDAANRVFAKTYESSREAAQDEVPVLVLMPGEVVLRRGAARSASPVFRASFAAAKDVAHIAVALFALTARDRHLSAESLERARGLRKHASQALDQLQDPALSSVSRSLFSVLELAAQFATEVVENRGASAEDRAAFASTVGPQLLRLTALATGEQIAELHRAVESLLAPLPSAERARVQVVVVGDHQARARSLGMQYFQRRLGEGPGEDERVTYGENIVDEEEALALVGTRRLDRVIAAAFFGDAKRLQRDVLGDAAKACLEQLDLPPL